MREYEYKIYQHPYYNDSMAGGTMYAESLENARKLILERHKLILKKNGTYKRQGSSDNGLSYALMFIGE